MSDTSHYFCIFSLVDPASSHILVSQSSLSQRICTCTDHPNVFTLAQVASAKEHRHLHISSSIYLTVLELFDLEIHQKKLGPDYHRLKNMVKRSIEQDIRNKNFGTKKWKL